MKQFWIIPLVLLATGCTMSAPPNAAAPSKPSNVHFVPDQGGLLVQPSGMRIDFGRAPSGVISALDRELGKHKVLSLNLCPSVVRDQLQWGDLTLSFSAERFIGWRKAPSPNVSLADSSSGTVCGS